MNDNDTSPSRVQLFHSLTLLVGIVALVLWGLLVAGGYTPLTAGKQQNTSTPPATATTPPKPPAQPQPWLREADVPAQVMFKDLGLDAVVYRVNAPPDVTVNAWIEYYNNGELREDVSFGVARTPQPGKAVSDEIRFTRYRPTTVEKEQAKKARWTFGLSGISTHRIVEAPFHGRIISARANLLSNNTEFSLGETYTLWSLAANPAGQGNSAHTGEEAAREDAHAVLLKVRFDEAAPQRSHSSSGTISVPPPSP